MLIPHNCIGYQCKSQIPKRDVLISTPFTTSCLQAQENTTSVEPNSNVSIPFTISLTANGTIDASATGNFTVRTTNDRSYPSTAPSSIAVVAGSGGVVNSSVALMVPSTAESGSDVTVTIEVENTATSETNYAVLRFSITAKVQLHADLLLL